MILVVLAEGDCSRTLSSLRKYGGDISQTEQGGVKPEKEMVEDRKVTDLPVVRE